MLGIMLSYREKLYPLLYSIVIYNNKHKAEMATLAFSQAVCTYEKHANYITGKLKDLKINHAKSTISLY